MKKFTVLTLIGLLILAFGVTAYSQEKAPVLEFKASGFIDVITEYNRNVLQAGNVPYQNAASAGNYLFGDVNPVFLPTAGGLSDKAFDKTQAYMETRGRLRFDAILGKEMMGTFLFEIDSTRWGEVAPSYAPQRNYAGHWGCADRASVEVKNMFLTFAVPAVPIPITVQAGIEPLYIRPGVFLATDGPGVIAAAKIDPATIRLLWFKALENEDYAADDVDFYAVEAFTKIDAVTIGGYAVNVNANTYPVQGNPTLPTAGSTPVDFMPATYAYSQVDYKANMWWLGLYLDGKLGPVNLNFDFIYDKGKVEDFRDVLARADDVKYNGFLVRLKVDYPWEKFNFGAVGIYGSGADQQKTSSTGLPNSAVADGTGVSTKVGTYIVPPGTEGGNGDSLIIAGSGINRMNTQYTSAASSRFTRAPLGGLWIGKVYGSVMAAPWYKVTLEAYYIGDTTKNGNTIGTAREADNVAKRDDKNIGWEIDVFNEIQIYKNLKWGIGAGILFAGDAMDYWVSTADGNVSPKNPWALTTNLTYSF
jgi:hypothetical protein